MARATVQIVIGLMLLTAASNAIMFSGVGAALDIQPSTGAEGQVAETQEDASQIEPSQGNTDTLFSLYTSVTSTMNQVFQIVFAAPLMFINLGVPTWLTGFIFTPLVVIVAVDVANMVFGGSP